MPKNLCAALCLLCALCVSRFSPAQAADGCEALNGTYQYESAAPRNGLPEYLSNFVTGKDKGKLISREGTGPKSLSGGGMMARPKITHLATRVTLVYAGTGTKLQFLDAQGKAITELGIDQPRERWMCKGARLERRTQRTAGLGNVLNTERVEETFARDAAGDLVYTETITVIDPPGGKPRSSEAHFKLAQAAG